MATLEKLKEHITKSKSAVAEGLKKAVDEINKLEKTTVTTDVIYRYNELFVWFLIPALILIILSAAANIMITGRLI